jgi:polysaccharide biosynthesis transport protein
MNSLTRGPVGQDETASPALEVARRRWWIVVLTTIVAVGIAVAGLSVVTPTYQATVTLQTPAANGVQTPSDLTYVDRLMNTYTLLAQQASLRAEVARQLGVATSPPLSVVVQPNTELLQLSASDRSAARAQLAANTAATVLVSRATALAKSTSSAGEQTLTNQLNTLSEQITRERASLASVPLTDTAKRLTLQQQISGDQANYQALAQQRAQLQVADATRDQPLSVIQSADLPTSPASPKWTPVLALALALGLLGGLALVFVVERFKPRLYTVEAIESAAEAEVLAAIPRVTGELADRRLYNGGSPAQEAFGVLAVHVLAGIGKDRPRTILVTSRNKGDGKSTVASNLATELAKSGREVLLVDADMRAPSIHKIFKIDDGVGLSNLLESGELSSMLDEFIVRPIEDASLSVIPAGPMPAAPARLLASEAMGRLMAELVARYEFVVVDAPPLVVSDPLSVARMSDLVLLVIGGDAVPDRDIQAATRQLAGIGAENVSVVVNRWRGRDTRYSYTYGNSR